LAAIEVEARFPLKLEFLFKPARYKVAYGGRGGTKSWGFARALLILGAERKLRILCTREVQKSIKDSVHQLLGDQIEALGLGGAYQVLATEIRGSNGTQFLFAGLSDLTVESIKSFEGVDIVWVEEARAVTKRSWSILIPTIRKDGSEIWVSFNPELDTDETYVRFVTRPPPDAVVVKLTYRDNPWFPEVLEKERLHCQSSDPEGYPNIWEGECKAAVDGAIYATEVSKMQQEGRFRPVPYDPMLKVHVICDLGFNDSMAIGLVQSNQREIRIIGYIEDSHRTLDSYSAELKDKRLNWGKLWLPHDAKHKTLASGGRSVEQIMGALGWDTDLVPDAGVEFGIKKARMMLPRTYMDSSCVRLMECLKRYRRGIPSTTGEPGAPVHDEFSHGADMVRYLAVVHEQLKNEDRWGKQLAYRDTGIV
jgi:phage terminase large subunit